MSPFATKETLVFLTSAFTTKETTFSLTFLSLDGRGFR